MSVGLGRLASACLERWVLRGQALGTAGAALLSRPDRALVGGMVMHRSWWGSGVGGVWGVTIVGE